MCYFLLFFFNSVSLKVLGFIRALLEKFHFLVPFSFCRFGWNCWARLQFSMLVAAACPWMAAWLCLMMQPSTYLLILNMLLEVKARAKVSVEEHTYLYVQFIIINTVTVKKLYCFIISRYYYCNRRKNYLMNSEQMQVYFYPLKFCKNCISVIVINYIIFYVVYQMLMASLITVFSAYSLLGKTGMAAPGQSQSTSGVHCRCRHRHEDPPPGTLLLCGPEWWQPGSSRNSKSFTRKAPPTLPVSPFPMLEEEKLKSEKTFFTLRF